MGKRGPKKTATPILKTRGSWLAKLRKDIEMADYKPSCPRWLSEEAKKYWHQIVPELEKTGILAKVDADLLAMLCKAKADFIEADKHCQSVIVKTSKGNIIQNPILSARNKAEDYYIKLAALFGMGSANRAGMGGVQRPKAGDSKARFFQKGREGA
jgi:P27 family predicted phage terminase small subunit